MKNVLNLLGNGIQFLHVYIDGVLFFFKKIIIKTIIQKKKKEKKSTSCKSGIKMNDSM